MSETARKGTLKDLKFDRRNANKGTEYGNHLLGKSVQELGIGRGIVVAADGTIIGGNQTAAKLGELGLEDVIIVPTDGKTLVVTQRMDIAPGSKEFHELALADNRVGQVNLDFDDVVLQELGDEFDINLNDWGMNVPGEEDEDEEPEEKEPKEDNRITFQLSPHQLTQLKTALKTAKLEGSMDEGKETDGEAIMAIVKEYLTRRK